MSFFATKIEFLKGIGPQKAVLLNKELGIFTFGDLIEHYPYRYEDRTIFHQIKDVNEQNENVQLKGRITHINLVGSGPKRRFVAHFTDNTGEIELVWFKSIAWVQKYIKTNIDFVVYGKPTWFHHNFSIAHPEIDPLSASLEKAGKMQPIYHSTEKLRNFGIDSKGFSRLMAGLLENALPHIHETLPSNILSEYHLIDKKNSLKIIHFPPNEQALKAAQHRLKFEELFYNQLKILQLKQGTKHTHKGMVVKSIPLVHEFYKSHLPFDLTNAQKRVVKEIFGDMHTGKQMNRLLQGDVGSGKTIVAFIVMLMVIDADAQAVLMAPTEILANQHFESLMIWASKLNIKIEKLTGSSKKSERERIHEGLLNGEIKILVGTHALLEDVVRFKNLGLCVIDEQHRFGVAQRARLWTKNQNFYPHVLVMTATPIPRTLAMTFYGDLDVSVIDELPVGRKPIITVHRMQHQRLAVYGFLKQEIALGRQVYVVYPLIEESEKAELLDLMNGYEAISREFPIPNYYVSIVHGRMKASEKEAEMKRFVKGETQIMVATTVIEVGVNVPNASVMVIENSERFGLAQLHQLRGRVGRGAEQSYCILMTGDKVGADSREKIKTMVKTNNGFEIAEADLKLRGPGDLMGTKQSGVLDLIIADLAKDQELLKLVRNIAQQILDTDFHFQSPQNKVIKQKIESLKSNQVNWSRIS